MELLIKARPLLRSPTRSQKARIQKLQRAPIQTTPHKIDSLACIRDAIAPGLHKINLPAERPRPIHIINGQHPDRGPEPVSPGNLRADLYATVLDRVGEPCGQAGGLDRVDDGLGGDVRDGAAASVGGQRRVCAAGEVEGVPVEDVFAADYVFGFCGHDVEDPILNEGVVRRGSGHLEFSIAKSLCQLSFRYGNKGDLPKST